MPRNKKKKYYKLGDVFFIRLKDDENKKWEEDYYMLASSSDGDYGISLVIITSVRESENGTEGCILDSDIPEINDYSKISKYAIDNYVGQGYGKEKCEFEYVCNIKELRKDILKLFDNKRLKKKSKKDNKKFNLVNL